MGVLWGRARLAQVAVHEGSLAEAHQILVDVIENFHAAQNNNGLSFALDKMASLYVLTDRLEAAARLIAWSDANRRDIGDPRPRIEQEEVDRDIATIKAKIGSSAFKVAYDSGRKMTLDEAVALSDFDGIA
jgi:hypothetical protein